MKFLAQAGQLCIRTPLIKLWVGSQFHSLKGYLRWSEKSMILSADWWCPWPQIIKDSVRQNVIIKYWKKDCMYYYRKRTLFVIELLSLCSTYIEYYNRYTIRAWFMTKRSKKYRTNLNIVIYIAYYIFKYWLESSGLRGVAKVLPVWVDN